MIILFLLVSVLQPLITTQAGATDIWGFGVQEGIIIIWIPPASMDLPTSYTILRRKAGSSSYTPYGYTHRGNAEQLRHLAQKTTTKGHADTIALWCKMLSDARLPDTVRSGIDTRLRWLMLSDLNTLLDAARWLGTHFFDSSTIDGEYYDYSIETNGQRIAELRFVRAGETLTPPMPSLLQARTSANGVTLSWDIRGSRRNGIWGYHVWRRDGKGTNFRRITAEPVMTLLLDESLPISYLYADHDIQADQYYTYAVSAVNMLGVEGTISDTVGINIAAIPPIRAPVDVIAHVDEDRVEVRWAPLSGSTSIAGYHVWRCQDSIRHQCVRLTTQPIQAQQWVESLDTVSNTYIAYAITAVNIDGLESSPAISNSVFVPIRQIPALPLMLEGIGEVGQVRLRWTRSPSPNVWGYEIGRSIAHPESTITLISVELVQDTMFTDLLPLASSRVTYWYRIRVVSRHGIRSNWSMPVRVILPDIVPPQRPNLEEIVPGDGYIALRWNQPHIDHDLAGFVIYRSSTEVETPIALTPKGLTAEQRTYTDSSVTGGIFYTYAIVAYDSAGNRSKPSRRMSARCYDSRQPPVPEIDTIISTSDGITITWHYRGVVAPGTVALVERSNDGISYAPISPLLPALTTRYSDGSADISIAYYYRVLLRSPAGTYSAPSLARASSAARRRSYQR